MPAVERDEQATYWNKELERAKKRSRTFWENGDHVIDAYRLEKADGNDAAYKDKYNILYSSTETIRPNLYAQEPKPRVVLRNKDLASPAARTAAMLLEGCIEYVQGEEDFDNLMDGVVEDFLLPGLGIAWVRYEANVEGEGENAKLLDEMVRIEYGYWQDVLFGTARVWKDVPWVAKRCWFTKPDAVKRFGAAKANTLQYATRDATGRDSDNPSETAEVWEIWHKASRTVHWYADGAPSLLQSVPDPLRLKNFYPCPRPLRAVANTRTMVPRALYSQYKSQAETLNVMTKRIRLLSEALRVVGVYDASQAKLADILNPMSGNRMIPVDNWAMFAQQGGIQGAVAWVPIDQVVKVLNELLKAREICKQEIYEVTGFSDIVRGVSKASETLGAQNLKANWAGARVRKMQAEVQRFARDLLALAGELIAEHCAPETIAIFAGISVPPPEQVQADPQLQAQIAEFGEACALIRDELRRVSTIDIETDSTLLADETAEREDRTKFLAAAGAFLQQAVPAMEAKPELGSLLGAMLMFVVRTFPSSRPIEDEFERVQAAMLNTSTQQQQDPAQAAAAAEQQTAQMEAQLKQAELQQTEADAVRQHEREMQAEMNRHAEKMEELRLKAEDLRVKKFSALHSAGMAELQHAAGADADIREEQREYDRMDREDAHKDADRSTKEADRDQEYDRMDRDDAHREADREAAEAAQERQEAAKAPEGGEDS